MKAIGDENRAENLEIHTHSLHTFLTTSHINTYTTNPRSWANKEILEKIYQILEPTDT